MNRMLLAFAILLSLTIMTSCSGSLGTPVEPGPLQDGRSVAYSGGPQLWGFWDVEWNPAAGTFDTVPLRSAMFAVNVIKFINMSNSNLIINVNSIVPDALWTDFDIDVGLVHPFPGLERYTGFDVMGIFMGNGSAEYPGPDGFAIAGSVDQQMQNPDGYTRRFNATEFSGAGLIMPLQGYIPGKKGNPGYVPTAVLNPYKYYADGLDADSDAFDFLVNNPENRGCFRPGSANYRNFKIRMPNQTKKFQYAVLANWEPNINNPDPPDSLDDFPPEANSQEAVVLKTVDSSDAWFVSPTVYGGDIILDITPWDWSASGSGVMEEYSITLYSPAWTGPFTVDMTPTVEAEHHYTFQASIPGSMLVDNGDQPVWVEVDYPDYDYTSPVGVPNDATGQLAAYFTTEVNILDHDPTVTPSDNFIYGFTDCEFVDWASQTDNYVLFSNMLNLPLEGPNAEGKKILYYEGRTYQPWHSYFEFASFVQGLGYEWQLVSWDPSVPVQLLDTTGVKMLFIATYFVEDTTELFHPEEIQAIKDLLNGGGICVIVFEHGGCFDSPYGTNILDQLLTELHPDFNYPALEILDTMPYTDITPDPITQGVFSFTGSASGRFDVFGEGVSLIRGPDYLGGSYTAVCKSPWEG